MRASPESRARTRAFARVIGPFVTVVTSIVAVRLPEMGALQFFDLPILVWMTGALLLFAGILIIANHQIWSSAPAIAISLFGWFLALRGLALLAVPNLIARGVSGSMEAMPIARAGMALLAGIGAWLTYVGWVRKLEASPAP